MSHPRRPARRPGPRRRRRRGRLGRRRRDRGRRARRGRARRRRPRGGPLLPDPRLHRQRLGHGPPALPRRRRDDGDRRSAGPVPGGQRGRRLDRGQRRDVVAHARAKSSTAGTTRPGSTGIRARDMEPCFERVERRLHVAHQDPESIGKRQPPAQGGRRQDGLEGDPEPAQPGPLRRARTTARSAARPGPSSRPWSATCRARCTSAPGSTPTSGSTAITRHGKRATGVVGHVTGADGRAPPDRGPGQAGRVGVRRDPHPGPARPLGRADAVGHARRQPVAPPQHQGGRGLRRGRARLGGRPPGVPGPRVPGRGLPVRRGQHAARGHRDDVAALRRRARRDDGRLRPDGPGRDAGRGHQDRPGPHDRRPAPGLLPAVRLRRRQAGPRGRAPVRAPVRGRRPQNPAAVRGRRRPDRARRRSAASSRARSRSGRWRW